MHLRDLLCPARVYENAMGHGRRAFALALAGELPGPVLWVLDARARDGLYAPGIAAPLVIARL